MPFAYDLDADGGLAVYHHLGKRRQLEPLVVLEADYAGGMAQINRFLHFLQIIAKHVRRGASEVLDPALLAVENKSRLVLSAGDLRLYDTFETIRLGG